MTMLETRKAQAHLAIRIWKELLQQVGPDEAGRILRRAIAADARAAGMAFAKQTESSPSLEHFATVLTRWQEDNALAIEKIQLNSTTLSFTVVHCAYAQVYAEMGVPSELGAILSCSRDEPFAQGYSSKLRMERSRTIVEGSCHCSFQFHWSA